MSTLSPFSLVTQKVDMTYWYNKSFIKRNKSIWITKVIMILFSIFSYIFLIFINLHMMVKKTFYEKSNIQGGEFKNKLLDNWQFFPNGSLYGKMRFCSLKFQNLVRKIALVQYTLQIFFQRDNSIFISLKFFSILKKYITSNLRNAAEKATS